MYPPVWLLPAVCSQVGLEGGGPGVGLTADPTQVGLEAVAEEWLRDVQSVAGEARHAHHPSNAGPPPQSV